MYCRRTLAAVACPLLLGWAALPAAGAEPTKLQTNAREIAGTAEFLRSVPKHFAVLEACDPARGQVTLRIESEKEAKSWPVVPDAEVKVAGWWGRLDQFHPGDRVWAWFKTDRAGRPVAVSMLADELSEQDIHGDGLPVVACTGSRLTVQLPLGVHWKLALDGAEFYRGKQKATADDFSAGEKVYVESRAEPGGSRARLVLDREAFEARRLDQRAALRNRWTDEGLPGTVTFLHIFSGEMEAMLDHEAQRWGRSLRPGDKVTLVGPTAAGGKGAAPAPIPAVVRESRPWRERTQVRLVVNGVDQADLVIGQRVLLRMTPLSAEADSATLPADVDRPRSKEDRLDWFLATIYCTCKVRGDVCTGDFYTLASCNPNACGMPHGMRQAIAEKIDKGMSDRQILEELLREHGPHLLRPHLEP
jgi:hypothetical protein